MLVLGRKQGERIRIGDDIVVQIVTASRKEGGKTRVGIEAPKGVMVHREEVYERVVKERQNGES